MEKTEGNRNMESYCMSRSESLAMDYQGSLDYVESRSESHSHSQYNGENTDFRVGENRSHSIGLADCGSRQYYGGMEPKSVTLGRSDRREETFDTSNPTLYNQCKKEGPVPMSYAHAILSLNRILLSSDSRSVIMRDDKMVSFSDTFKKIVYLPLMRVGIVSIGSNNIGGTLLTDILLSLDTDNTENQTVRKKFSYILDNLKNRIQPGMHAINIACGGYDGQDASLFYSDVTSGNAPIKESDFIWYTTGKALDMFKDPQNSTLNVDIMDVQSMIDFSDFIVNAEINWSRFSHAQPVVGGPVQTLLIEPTGPKWIHAL